MERKSKFFSIVALTVLTALIALPAKAEQLRSRESQGNNVGVRSKLGWGMPWTGGANWHYPRGSNNGITNDGWTMAIYAAIDIDGTGTAADTEGINHMRAMMPGLASLESKSSVEAEAAAGSYMEGEMGETRYNRIWTNLDAAELAAWPIEGRIPRGDPNGVPNVPAGGETQFFHSSDCFTTWGMTQAPAGAAYEWTLRFLNFAESNQMVYGSLFIRNMSEYVQYNPNANYGAVGQAHPGGWNWAGATLIVNHRSLGYSGTAAGWALKASKEILCFYGRSPTSGAWTPNRLPLLGFKMINPPHNDRETMQMTSIHHHDWCAEFGFSGHRQMFVGFPFGVGYRVAMDQETGYYPGVTNPWTGEPLRGAWPGMLQPDDARYDQWIWGGPCSFMTYACYGELHDVAPRDTITCDFTYAFTTPGVENYVRPELDVAEIDNPIMQDIMNPIEHMMEVSEIVTNGGYSLPNTPVMPPLTIVPGDREVTITWSDLPLQQPDAYYYFLQDNPSLDPNGVYREYDFEGFRVYRSYVGPNDSHSELLADYNLSDGNLQFHYIDRNVDDLNRYRMRNGMKVWYAVVPYDRNFDPATGDAFSLPDPASGKTWNRPGATLYTVIPRSDASNYKAAEMVGYEYVPASRYSAVPTGELTVALAGDGTVITEDPVFIPPMLTSVTWNPVLNEKITSDLTFSLIVTDDISFCSNTGGSRFMQLATSGGSPVGDPKLFNVRTRNRGIHLSSFVWDGDLTSEGSAWTVGAMAYTGRRQAGEGRYALAQIDAGGYAGATFALNNNNNLSSTGNGTVARSERLWGLSVNNGAFVITWSNSGGSVSVSVTDRTHGQSIPFSPYIDEISWGFVPPGVDPQSYKGDLGVSWGEGAYNPLTEVSQADRSMMLVETLPADNTDNFALWVGGVMIHFMDVSSMPASGTEMVLRTALGSWSGEEFVQGRDVPMPGDKWKFTIKAMSMDPDDADLTKVRVVPNPYMASSFLDLSMDNRRIEFVNLPDRCTIRIYTLKGNLVNVLNHIGANREGWGNYTDWDRLASGTSEPAVYTGYDNHGGTEPWNLRNRWGQLIASGLYFFHVTDQRGETYTGKFYIVN